MVDSLAAKIGIGEAARRDPVGRSPSQKTPQNNSLSPQRSVQPKTPSSRSRRARSTTRCGSCPISLRLDVGRLFGGLSGSIAGVTWLTDQLGIRVFGTRLPREKRTGPAHERQWSAIIVPLRCFHQRSSWAISPTCSDMRCDPKARPRSNAHRDAASLGRALGRGLAHGFRFGRDVALVTQT
jgi:hypothetical protein